VDTNLLLSKDNPDKSTRRILKRSELKIVGFGGSAVVLVGNIIGQAVAVFGNGYATFSQGYTPETRGSYSDADIVLSDEPVGYPYAVKPNVLVTLTQDAYNKYTQEVSPETLVIVDPDQVKPDLARTPSLLTIPVNKMGRELGGRVANVVLVGFLAAITDLVPADALRKSVLASAQTSGHGRGPSDLNIKAFEMGYKYGLEHGKRSV
jgi:2-oxoglutarate ferredoxin oxidoreductase subunit gamma